MNIDSEYCDLHVHSNFSDGENSPEELVKIAEEAGLSAVSLCDHNNVGGIRRFIDAAKDSSVEAVPGIEITADHRGTEVHILGLCFDLQRIEAIEEFVSRISLYKEESNVSLAKKLNEAGIGVDLEKIKASTGGFVNRVHFAKELMRLGYVGSVSEAFAGYLGEKGGFYSPAKHLDSFEVIEFLRSIGAVPVIAHPFISLSYDRVVSFLPEAKAHGLIGMETNYSQYGKADTEAALRLAKKFGLLPSGGSDFHGCNKPDIKMGIGKGDLKIPTEYFYELKKAAKK